MSRMRTTLDRAQALPGRAEPAFTVPARHAVLDAPLLGPFPDGTRLIYLALGCFWGAEKAMWTMPGVVGTAAGYQGGYTSYPTYEEVCTGLTGHAETVMVAYDPHALSDEDIIRTFWQLHDPTQGNRQGNDVGTQYRSAVYYTTQSQRDLLYATAHTYGRELHAAGFGAITTEIRPLDEAGRFFPAEPYHQQYLAKNPGGYCPVHSTGVLCP